MATHSRVLAWRILGTVGSCLWGRTESDTTEVTQQQQQQRRLRMSYLGQETSGSQMRGFCLVYSVQLSQASLTHRLLSFKSLVFMTQGIGATVFPYFSKNERNTLFKKNKVRGVCRIRFEDLLRRLISLIQKWYFRSLEEG